MKFFSKSDKETMKIGAKFAKTLNGGEVVLLVGDLGSGKTTFVKGVADAVGVKKVVNSPTFVIMKVYKTEQMLKRVQHDRPVIKNLVHIDAYRGVDLPELENIGAVEYFGRADSVCFVEWGGFLDKIQSLKFKCQKVVFKNISENGREIEFGK
jgi:tRNA threonylcarbamoyladenosine biosynthesis protein TsaE